MFEEPKQKSGIPTAFDLTNSALRLVGKGLKAGFNVVASANDERLRRSALHEIHLIMFGVDPTPGHGLPPVRPLASPLNPGEVGRFKKNGDWLVDHNALPDYARRFA